LGQTPRILLYKTFWILSSGIQEQIEQRQAQMQNYIPNSASWRRDEDSSIRFTDRLDLEPQFKLQGGGIFEQFGLGNSSVVVDG
jgi:hypothetical protein